MVSSSALIAAFAFVNRPQEQQRGLRRQRSTPAFVSPEQKIISLNSNGHRGLHPTLLFAAESSSSESDASSKTEDSSSSSSSSSLSSSSSSSKSKVYNKGEASSSTKGETTAVPTKTATVTKLPKRNTNATTPIGVNDGSSTSVIQGLLPSESFNLLCRIHCVLTLLRKHFPTLLELPALSYSSAQWMYAPNITVSGPKDEELAVGLDEVLLLSRALATAATTARRAGNLFDLALSGSSSSGGGSPAGQLECELLIDPGDPLRVAALWRTRLPSIGIGGDQSSSLSSYTEFSGRSTVHLCPRTGLVSKLKIQEVKINGVAVIESLGTALAAVRRAARSAGAMAPSSLFDDGGGDGRKRSGGNPLLDGILNGIQDVVDAVDALPSEEKEGPYDSPLYVVPARFWGGAVIPMKGEALVYNSTALWNTDGNATSSARMAKELNEKPLRYVPVPIDNYSRRSEQTSPPLVGSGDFVKYATCHVALQRFANYGLRQLAGVPTLGDSGESISAAISAERIRSLFSTDAELLTFGSGSSSSTSGTALLRGAGKVADLYRSLALFREASGGNWGITSLEADFERPRLVVSWATESPVKIEGTDRFVFDVPSSSLSYCLPLCGDGNIEEIAEICATYFKENDNDEIPLRIRRIENLQLKVAGVTTDSAWAQSFVSAALRSGITENTPLIPDTTIAELLRALTTRKSSSSAGKSPPPKKATKQDHMPALGDEAAASFYRILCALHSDISSMADGAGASGPSSPGGTVPAGDFLAETVELRGLLGEVLARGRSNYRGALGVAISSLRVAVQTRAVRLAARPRPTVEVTPRGSIKVNFILALWANPPSLPVGGALVGGGQGINENGGFGVPLKIEVCSEYIIDDETGKIREHQILESRLNGVLTPGDVFSRWIKGLTGGETADNSSGNSAVTSAMESLTDAIAWVRSMQDRK